MFGKLVKHEFRATARIIPFAFMVTIFLALLHIISSRLNIGIASKLSLVLMIIMCIGQVMITFVLLIWRYYKNLYANEGYLTHTLPVQPSQLLWSKLLVGFVWSVLSYLVAIAAAGTVLIVDFVKESDKIASISAGYHAMLAELGLENHQAAMWITIAAFMAISIGLVLTEIYFAISAGNVSKLHSLSIGGPILIYFAEYTALQIVAAVTMLFLPLSLQFPESSGGALTGFKVVTKSMFSQMGIMNHAGISGANETAFIGLGYYILIPFILIGLLCWTAQIINRHTSVK